MQCLEMKVIYAQGKIKETKNAIWIPRGKYVQVPCGKCAFCLVNKRSSWMFRIHQEMRCQQYPGWFLTLTYDEKHVKRVYDSAGLPALSLRFKDVQKWFKRLRKAKFYVKYVCVGEYGSETNRPHYHCLVWTDASPEELQRQWWHGNIDFGGLTISSAMYTLKYIIQPKPCLDEGVERPRAQFSRGLGIGYLTTEVYDYHTVDYDNPTYFTIFNGAKVALPRYYTGKIFTKYQCNENRKKVSRETEEKHKELVREYESKGIVDAESHIRHINQARAQMIIKKTKHNQVL